MKKGALLSVSLCFLMASSCREKHSYTLAMDVFDVDGNKHSFEKKFDHITTHDDSIEFYRSTKIKPSNR